MMTSTRTALVMATVATARMKTTKEPTKRMNVLDYFVHVVARMVVRVALFLNLKKKYEQYYPVLWNWNAYGYCGIYANGADLPKQHTQKKNKEKGTTRNPMTERTILYINS